MHDFDHLRFMELALREARLAAEEGEVPVGAVVVCEGAIVARDRNRREALQDPTAHAEMLALTAAANAAGTWRLTDCVLYATLEPCPMCAGAVVQARIPLVVFGAYDPKAGACGSLFNIANDPRLNHRARILGGVLAEPCGALLSEFFAFRRSEGKK
jgi:tRNA(adenine34) deaminase